MVRFMPAVQMPTLARYAIATAIVAATAILRFSLQEVLAQFPLLLFIPAVFLCAMLFDRGTGYYATALSAFTSAYFFMDPIYTLNIGARNWFALFLFVCICIALVTVTEALRKTVEQLKASEAAKGLLHDELAHRTKNDLALIISALSLQANSSGDPAVRAALKAAEARVMVVSRAQDSLRMDDQGGHAALDDYIGDLCRGLGDMLRDVRPIAVRVDCERIVVTGPTSVTIGLIVNELVTNSLKYAYPEERGGIITVSIRHEGQKLIIIVEDDGIGCSAETPSGLGSKLVRLLAKQLGGSFVREAREPGCRVRVVLEDPAVLAPAPN